MTKAIDIIRLKEKVEHMRQDRDKAQGAFDQIMNQIETDFGCKSLKAAEKKLHIMQRKLKQDSKKILKEKDEIEREVNRHAIH